MEDHLVALNARLAPLKIIGVDLLDVAIHAFRALWPDVPSPKKVPELVEWLMASDSRLDEWRGSAARAGADEAMAFILSWYEEIKLEAVQTLRTGSKWITDLEHIRKRQETAYNLAQYAATTNFIKDPNPDSDEEEEPAEMDQIGRASCRERV